MIKKEGLITFVFIIGAIIIILFSINFISAKTIEVCKSGCNYSSINDAVYFANKGDIINVGPGIYYENQIYINKSLDIIGSGIDNSIIDGENSNLDSTGTIKINVDSGGVLIKGFTIKNPGSYGGEKVLLNTYSKNAGPTYEIYENKFLGNNEANEYGIYSEEGKEILKIKNNQFNNIYGNSIFLKKHGGSVEVSENIIELIKKDAISINTQDSFDITTTQRITNNSIDLSKSDGNSEASGIKIYTNNGNYLNIIILDNKISGIKKELYGILLYNDAGSDGINGLITNPIIRKNVIEGVNNIQGGKGIVIYGKTNDLEIKENKISNLDKALLIRNNFISNHFPIETIVEYNSFANNNYAIIYQGIDELYAEYNWFNDCRGPGTDINKVFGNIDYTHFLGVCIENIQDVPCSLDMENLEVRADIIGEDVNYVFISYTINGSNYNKSAIPEKENRYLGIIPSNLLKEGLNVQWRFFARDNIGNIIRGEEKSTEIALRTKLNINPSEPDGKNGWYISSPTFSLENPRAIKTYYRWDGLAYKEYTSYFSIKDAPNNANQTGGLITLRYYSETICGKEKELEYELKLDNNNPRIVNIDPKENSINYIKRPIISFDVDDIYKNSGIVKEKIIVKLDSNLINFKIEELNYQDLRVIVLLENDLSQGSHSVEVEIEDGSGRKSFKTWIFNVTTPNDYSFNVFSPLNGIYSTRNVLFNISSNEKLSKIVLINQNDKNPKDSELCKNCYEYGYTRRKTKTLNEGENNLTIKTIDSFSNIKQEERVIYIDSKKPIVHKVGPRKQTYNNGSFYIKYSEDYLQNITLYYGIEGAQVNSLSQTCEQGKNKECFFFIDLKDYWTNYIDYWFIVSDRVNQVKTEKIRIKIDTTTPELKVNLPLAQTYSDSRIQFNISSNELVTIEYKDLLAKNPNVKRLCSNCNDYGKKTKKTELFSKGEHKIEIRIYDKAFNSITKEVSFNIL
ncbi:MAG: hypothetical protein WC867_03490 [Candidatus Pacearchaeota archaeon]|jgi:hypothetical protein